MFKQPATLELTHNWGTEDDPNFKAHNGNDKPQGYGHIGYATQADCLSAQHAAQ